MGSLKKIIRGISFVAAAIYLCLGQQANADSERHNISVGDEDRSYLLYVPSSLKQGVPVPLVIMMHGGFGTGAQAEKSYGWDTAAEKGKFIVAYPDGIRRSWNAGGTCCGRAIKDNVDDLGFITKVIVDISAAADIDAKRVYLTGMSNGAAMAYRYACEGSYPVAAIGPVSGSLSTSCAHPRALSVMEIHGMEDHNIPFTGGTGSKGVSSVNWLGVQQTLNYFRSAEKCQNDSPQKNGVVTTYSAVCAGGNEVTLITIDGEGHQWPGGKSPGKLANILLPLDPPSGALNATATLWAFFQKHPAP